jgi:2-polyprenyl-3-methyl-5-hydroxy-6-metoxy-1,4-benzoquinol methylase
MVNLIRDKHGFMRVDPLPSEAEISDHYRQNYFGGGKVNSYDAHYDSEELEHKAITHREALYLWSKSAGGAQAPAKLSMLDVGCGEGFSMAGFAAAGWSVTGVDFTSEGIDRFNPAVKDRLVLGDIYGTLDAFAKSGRKFSFLMCTNLLEHVRDPAQCLQILRRLVEPGGVLRVEVPNDGSWLQNEVVRNVGGPNNFWVAAPDHLSYFTLEPMIRLAAENGWKVTRALGDFPIDLFLLNPNSNYILEPSRGKAAHRVCVTVEVTIARQGIDRLIAFRDGCAKVGLGRTIIGYFDPA